jgi:hypothetical protein
MRETVQVYVKANNHRMDGSIIRHSRMKASSIKTEIGIWNLTKMSSCGINIKSRLCSFVFYFFQWPQTNFIPKSGRCKLLPPLLRLRPCVGAFLPTFFNDRDQYYLNINFCNNNIQYSWKETEKIDSFQFTKSFTSLPVY